MLNPSLLVAFVASYTLQGILIAQVWDYVHRSWRLDTTGTRFLVSTALVSSIIHHVFLAISVYPWQNVPNGVLFAAFLMAKLLSFVSQVFFCIRVYYLPWRHDYLSLPLLFFTLASVMTPLGLLLIQPSLMGTLHRLKIASSAFPLLLSAWSCGCIFGNYMSTKSKTKRTLLNIIMHSSFPGTFFLSLALVGAILNAEALGIDAGGIVGVAGCVQAMCMLWALQSRPDVVDHEETFERDAEDNPSRLVRDLAWTRAPYISTTTTIPRRVTLLPIHSSSNTRASHYGSKATKLSLDLGDDSYASVNGSGVFDTKELNKKVTTSPSEDLPSKPTSAPVDATIASDVPVRPRPALIIPPPPRASRRSSKQTLKSVYSTDSAPLEAHALLQISSDVQSLPATPPIDNEDKQPKVHGNTSAMASPITPSGSTASTPYTRPMKSENGELSKSRTIRSVQSVAIAKTTYTASITEGSGSIPISLEDEDTNASNTMDHLPRSPTIALSRSGSHAPSSTSPKAERQAPTPDSPSDFIHPYARSESIDPTLRDAPSNPHSPPGLNPQHIVRKQRTPTPTPIPTYVAFMGQTASTQVNPTTRLPFTPIRKGSPTSSPVDQSSPRNTFNSPRGSPIPHSKSSSPIGTNTVSRNVYSPTGSLNSFSSARTLPERAPVPNFAPPSPESRNPSTSAAYKSVTKVRPPIPYGTTGML